MEDGFSGPAARAGSSMNALAASVQQGVGAASTAMTDFDKILENNSKKIQQSTEMMTAGFSLMAAGAATLVPIGLGLKVAAEFEKAEAGLTTLLKSADAAKQVMADVKEDAAKSTMFGFKDLLLGNQLLISTGMDAAKARQDINALADAIAATGGGSDELKRMSVNLQQIKSLGKATALDIKQFAFAGIDIYGLLHETTGKHKDELMEMGVTYEMLVDALRKASMEGGRFEGATERMSQTLAGRWAAFMDQIQFTLAEVGMAIKPFVMPLIDLGIMLMEFVSMLAANPLGKVIIGVIAVTGILLVTMGLLFTVMGAVRGAAFRLSTSFITMGATEIGAAFATGSLTLGFKALAVAVWTALAPLLPFIAIGVAIIAVGYGIYKALTSTNETFVRIGTVVGLLLGPIGQLFTAFIYLKRGVSEFKEIMAGTREPVGGFIGFMQKLGGIVMGVAAIFSSWNGSSFELSEEMHDALKKTGILEFVLNLGTWVVRIKEFLKGFISPFVQAWESISNLFSKIATLFEPIITAVSEWGGVIEKATGSTNLWNSAGEIMGHVFSVLLFPIVAVINAISFLIDLVTDFSGTIDRVMNKASELISEVGGALGFDTENSATNKIKNVIESRNGIVSDGLNNGNIQTDIASKTRSGGTNTKEVRETQLVQPQINVQIGEEQIYDVLTRMQQQKDSRN